MSKQKEVILGGVGGQGLIVCGTLLGEAAVLFDGKHAALSSEYGVETRGTFSKSDVIVSDEEILYPESIHHNVVLCLAQEAYQRYAGKLAAETLLIYDNTLVEALANQGNQIGVPIASLAHELGNPAAANIISMGLVVRHTNIITPEAAEKELRHYWGKRGEKVVSLNLKAFETGYAFS